MQPLTVAIIGAGKAGRALAAEAVRAGHHVVLEDVLPSKLRDAVEEIDTSSLRGTLQLVSTVEDAVREADFAIDFVPDELESKLEIVSMLDRMAPPKTVLCISTRNLSPTDLASCTYRADRCVGLRVHDREATVIEAQRTSAATLSLTEGLWASLGYSTSVQTEADYSEPAAGLL